MGNTRDARPLGTSPGCPPATQRVAAAKLEKLFRHCQASQHQREQALVSDLLRSTTAPGSSAEQRLRGQLREPTVNFEAFVAALDTEDAFVRRLFSHIYHNVQTQALLDATVRASSSSSPFSSESAAGAGDTAARVGESSPSASAGANAGVNRTQSSNPFMSILRRLRNRTTPLSSVLAGGIDTLPYGGSLFDQLTQDTAGGSGNAQEMDLDEDTGGAYNAYGYDDDQDGSESDDEGGRSNRTSPWYMPNLSSTRPYSTSSSDPYSSYHTSASASRLVARDFTGRPVPTPSSSAAAAASGATTFSSANAAGTPPPPTTADSQLPTRASDAVLASRPRFVRRLSLGLVSLPSSFTSTNQQSPPTSALPTAAATISPWALVRSSPSTTTTVSTSTSPPPTLASSSPATAPPVTSVSNSSSRRPSLLLTMPPAPAPTAAGSSTAFRFSAPSIVPTPSARDTSNPFTSFFSSTSAGATPSVSVDETPGVTFGYTSRSGMPLARATRDHRDRPSYASPVSSPSSAGGNMSDPTSNATTSPSASIAHQFARSIRIRAASLFGSSSLPGGGASAEERRRDPPASSGAGGAGAAPGST